MVVGRILTPSNAEHVQATAAMDVLRDACCGSAIPGLNETPVGAALSVLNPLKPYSATT
jgi:hypothetical protein